METVYRFNVWYFCAALLTGLTCLIHVIAGGADIYAPLRGSALEAEPLSTLSVVWHMVTAVLLVSAFGYARLMRVEEEGLALGLTLLNLAFALLFIAYGWMDFGAVFALPQWVAFGLIASLSALGHCR